MLHRVASRTIFPWPRRLGTAPWALARLASTLTGTTYGVFGWRAGPPLPRSGTSHNMWQRILGRNTGVRALLNAIDGNADCLLYVGGTDRDTRSDRWIPRHVVTILGNESDCATVRIFEPSSGSNYAVPMPTLLKPSGQPRPEFGNWCFPLLVVAPL